MHRIRVAVCLLVNLLVLSACKTELYSNLSESEANEMVAALLATGIDADKPSFDD